MKQQRLLGAIQVSEVAFVNFVIWFIGWLIYDTFELWSNPRLTPIIYQNLLLFSMTLTSLAGLILIRRSMNPTVKQNPDPKPTLNSKPDPMNPDVQEQLDEINEKLSDLHAMTSISSKRESAKSPPNQPPKTLDLPVITTKEADSGERQDEKTPKERKKEADQT